MSLDQKQLIRNLWHLVDNHIRTNNMTAKDFAQPPLNKDHLVKMKRGSQTLLDFRYFFKIAEQLDIPAEQLAVRIGLSAPLSESFKTDDLKEIGQDLEKLYANLNQDKRGKLILQIKSVMSQYLKQDA